MAKLVLSLLLLSGAVQNEPAEMKWASTKDDLFELKWTFEEVRRVEPGKGARTENLDKRTVEAELRALEEPGQYLVTLKKVSWTQNTEIQEVTVTWAEGKPATAAVKAKPLPPAPDGTPVKTDAATLAQLKKAAESTGEHMKKLVSDGEHKLIYDPQQKVARFARNGQMGRNLLVLDRAFLHTTLPNGTVNDGLTWKEELDRSGLPTEVEVKTVSPKVSFSGPNLNLKVGFQQPINIPGADTTGSVTLAREFSFSRDFHLTSSREELTYSKKIDPKGKDLLYKNSLSQSSRQSLTIKKIVPKEEKPAGK
jgi:hypothetical protein